MKPSEQSAIVNTHPKRILVRATNWIGDTVMTLPAVQRLRELEPDAHLTVASPEKLADLWRHNPHVNDVLTGPLPRRQFDLAIIFPNSFRSAWECYTAGIPRRVGFTGHWRRALLTDALPDPEQSRYEKLTVAGKQFERKIFPVIRHQSHRYLDLIGHLGGNRTHCPPKLWIAAGEIPALTKFLHEGSRPFFGINAGAEYGPAKRWPAENFISVAKNISAEVACRWLIFGGPGDTAIAGQIETDLRTALDDRSVVNVAGKTNLLELCQLLKFCRLLITNDTGPMHLADALGTPLVAIFGSTSAPLTGPTGKHSRVVNVPVECNPCFLRECPVDFRCMQAISVDQVTAAARQLWTETEKTHGHI
ncbi:MAG: ADP-heptose--LPS heptosyltransferase 2 [Verrucomicrobiae bacterium]|nr:ADP-heptose--LPS heptosyltransferase 2 [Verrucomicrobiae bacterium]